METGKNGIEEGDNDIIGIDRVKLHLPLSFLRGLEIFGRGDWRSISRYCVKTRTPAQVASHAQKYFLHLESVNKPTRRGRPSILDITSADAETSGVSQEVPSTNNDISHPVTRIGSDLEALITEHMDENNDVNSIFYYTVSSLGAINAPENNAAASLSAMNAPQNGVSVPAQLPPFACSSNFDF
ncbi:Transcription factor DIVARICATA [Capsicum chinense]|nr:Transcription factor DIVARICATA [Capsicum chinense]